MSASDVVMPRLSGIEVARRNAPAESVDQVVYRVDRERKTVAQLEDSSPGISKLPARDASGAFMLSPEDLPD